MQLLIEDFVPYDASAAWRIHDAYFAERGIAAWTGGDIPFAGTNNSGVARQHARLLVELVRGLEARGALGPADPVHVLEVGSGVGTFALNFVEALAHGCGAAGKAIVPRLRYVLSDYAIKNLRESTAVPRLSGLVAAGTVVPALFDLRSPGELTLLDEDLRKLRGKRARGGPERGFAAVFLNYVCCVAPLKVVRATEGGLVEKHVRLALDVADEAEAQVVAATLAEHDAAGALAPRALLDRIVATADWRRLDAKRAFARAPHHRALLEKLLAALPGATVNYPHSFLDLLRGLRERVLPGGAYFVSDFGNPDRAVEGQAATNERAPVKYGLALTHDVDFVLFDIFAAHEGLGILRTDDGLYELHTAVLLNAPEVPDELRARFERTHRRRAKGQELLDLSAAALLLAEAGRHHEAARLYRQCLRIAPRSPQVIWKLGQACLAANLESARELERLARLLRHGQRLDAGGGRLDWDTLRGGVHLRLGDAVTARRILEASLRTSESAARHQTLALAYEKLGKPRSAYRALLRSLELEPEGERARETLAKLHAEYLGGDEPRVLWRKKRRS